MPVIVSEGDACGFKSGEKCASGLVCNFDDTCVPPAVEGDLCPDVGQNSGECAGSLLLNCSDDAVCVYGDYTGLCPEPPPI